VGYIARMRSSLSPQDLGFRARDRRCLGEALETTAEVRLYRRVQAVWLAAQGRTAAEVAQITALGLRSVYRLTTRYLKAHRVKDLADRPRPGRPPAAPGLTRARILRELRRSPLRQGYRTNVWTVGTLAHRLNERYQCSIGPETLRQRMKQIGLVCKRPRYFYSERAPHVAQKKGGHCAKNEGDAAQRRLAL
jgi:transposase